MSADDMQPDELDNSADQARMSFLRFLDITLTMDVGRGNRVAALVALAGVAWASSHGFWWSVLAVTLWWLFLQAILVDARMTGFLEGHEEGHVEGHRCAAGDGEDGLMPLPISVLVDFCQKHNIPPQEIERLIWRRGES